MANGTTNIGFEDKLWLAADKLRGITNAVGAYEIRWKIQ